MAGEYTLSLVMQANDRASSVVQGFLSNLGPIGGTIAVVGAAMLGVGATAVAMAGNFQESMTQLVTGAGESQANIAMVSNGILDMAVQTGTSTKQLADGMYMIESAGYHGAAGLTVLQTAAEGAKVGNADLGNVANALTTILTDYHMKGSQAADAMNALTTTVASGKTHLQDLASSMGSVLPLASALGIQFPQVGGALATMTNAGMSAQRAAMNLANAIRSLAAPNATAQKSMKAVGLTAQEVKDALSHGGLTAALQLVEDHVGKKFPAGSVQAVQAFKAIMGGATGYNVALMLGGKNMATFNSNVNAISTSMRGGKGAVQGWSDVQNDFNFKMAQAKEAVEVLMIKIGTALLPVVGKLFTTVTPLIIKFADWITKSGALDSAISLIGNVVGTLASVIGGLVTGIARVVQFFQQNQVAALALLIPLGALGGYFVFLGVSAVASFIAAAPAMIAGFIAGAAAAWTMAAGVIAATWPFLLIGAAIGLVIAIIILLVTHWKQVSAWLTGAWHNIASVATSVWGGIASFFVSVWNHIVDGFKAAINFIVNVVKIGFQLWLAYITFPIRAVVAIFSWLYQHNYYFQRLVDAIVNITKPFVAWLVNAWHSVVNGVVAVWNWLVNAAIFAFKVLVLVIGGPILWITLLIMAHWNQIKGYLAAAWAWIVSTAQTLWQHVVAIFAGAWSGISAAVHSIWTNLAGIFSNLASQAIQWGANIIKGFINGITSMIGAVGNAAHNVISTVAGFLGFHSPAKEGPGRTADKWGPNLVKMYAKGMTDHIPTLQEAVANLAQTVHSGLAYDFSGGGMGLPSHVYDFIGSNYKHALAPHHVTHHSTHHGAPHVTHHSTHHHTYHIHVHSSAASRKEFAKEIIDQLSHMQRMSGQQPATSSGRRW